MKLPFGLLFFSPKCLACKLNYKQNGIAHRKRTPHTLSCGKIFQLKLSEFGEMVLSIILWHVLNHIHKCLENFLFACVFNRKNSECLCHQCDVAWIRDMPKWYRRIKMCRIKLSVRWNTINYDMALTLQFQIVSAGLVLRGHLLISKIQQNPIGFCERCHFENTFLFLFCRSFFYGLRHQPNQFSTMHVTFFVKRALSYELMTLFAIFLAIFCEEPKSGQCSLLIIWKQRDSF